ncbi:MAG: hypothetical protein ABR532_05850 [Candidatus Dormibacteria bacterium]
MTDLEKLARLMADVEAEWADPRPWTPEKDEWAEKVRLAERSAAVRAGNSARQPEGDHLQMAFRKAVEAGARLR